MTRNNILIEFTSERVEDINALEAILKPLWYCLPDFQREGDKVRILAEQHEINEILSKLQPENKAFLKSDLVPFIEN
jgi:hypothetical protein